jgi:hypothetical protein
MIRPFGERSAEQEKQILGDSYSEYFFRNAPFNRDALLPQTYLIVGRRGAGKSSLAEFFDFQNIYPKSLCIQVNTPSLYAPIIRDISTLLSGRSVTNPRVNCCGASTCIPFVGCHGFELGQLSC